MEIKYLYPEKKIFGRVFINGHSGWPFDPDFINKRSFSLNIFYSINTNDIQHTYIVNIQSSFETFVSPIYGGSTQNLAVLAKLFRRCLSIVNGRQTQEHWDRR